MIILIICNSKLILNIIYENKENDFKALNLQILLFKILEFLENFVFGFQKYFLRPLNCFIVKRAFFFYIQRKFFYINKIFETHPFNFYKLVMCSHCVV